MDISTANAAFTKARNNLIEQGRAANLPEDFIRAIVLYVNASHDLSVTSARAGIKSQAQHVKEHYQPKSVGR